MQVNKKNCWDSILVLTIERLTNFLTDQPNDCGDRGSCLPAAVKPWVTHYCLTLFFVCCISGKSSNSFWPIVFWKIPNKGGSSSLMTSMSSSLWLTLMELRQRRPVPYLRVCWYTFVISVLLYCWVFCIVLISLKSWFAASVFNFGTGTGSDVNVPNKQERPRSSHAENHGNREYKHSANHNGAESRHSSTNKPALGDGNTPSREGSSDVLTATPGINQGVHVEQNNTACDSGKPAVKHSNSPRDQNSPQKHREKRKHCDSADSNKHKKRKRTHNVRFEGQRISHLVKKRTYEKADPETDGQKKSDDYVLEKLFKKSGEPFVLRGWFWSKIRGFFMDSSLNLSSLFRYPQRDATWHHHGILQSWLCSGGGWSQQGG